MSAAQKLDPKTLPSNQYKKWAKDSLELCKRVGILWHLIFTAVITSAGMGLALLLRETPLGLPAAAILITSLGISMTPFQMHALNRARRGEPTNNAQDMIQGVQDLAGNTAWIRREIIINLITILLFLIILLGLILLLPDKKTAANEVPKQVSTLIDTAIYFASFGFLYFWSTRSGGFFSMSYFLQVKEGLDVGHSRQLESLAKMRNTLLLTGASLFMTIVFFGSIFVSSTFSRINGFELLSPLFMSIISWFFAAMNHCAWHDIFDDDGGLAEKQKVSVFRREELFSA